MPVSVEQLKGLFLQAKRSLAEQNYLATQKNIGNLQQTLSQLFSNEDFNQQIFIDNCPESKELRDLLLAINDFFTEEVENLTIEADKTKNELNTLTKANEMKKAYGS